MSSLASIPGVIFLPIFSSSTCSSKSITTIIFGIDYQLSEYFVDR